MTPLPCLPVDSASSCSSQAPKSAIAGRGDDRHLVAARGAGRRRGWRQGSRPGFSAGGALGAQERTISAALSRKAAEVDADRRRRHHAEIRQHRIAPADARQAVEDVRGSPRSARVFSSDEPGSVMATKRVPPRRRRPPLAARVEEVLLEDVRLERAARLARDDEQRARRVDPALDTRGSAPDRSSRARAASGTRAAAPKVSPAPRGRGSNRPCRAAGHR